MNKEYKNEEEFLKDYDVKKHKQLSMTTDVVLISVSEEHTNNYRKNSTKKMSILLVKRENYPFKGKWCLPGGFVDPDTETLEECARRILKEETNLSKIYMEQLYTFDDLDRDPRCRVISATYMTLVDKNRLDDKINPNASWFNINSIEESNGFVTITLDNGDEIIKFTLKKTLREKTTDRYRYFIEDTGKIAFDHTLVIMAGIERLRNKLQYTDIVFNMMPEYFTLGELQQVYEVILGKKLLDPAFRRIIANKVEKTDKMATGKGHRPSVLFRYVNKKD